MSDQSGQRLPVFYVDFIRAKHSSATIPVTEVSIGEKEAGRHTSATLYSRVYTPNDDHRVIRAACQKSAVMRPPYSQHRASIPVSYDYCQMGTSSPVCEDMVHSNL
jgi:hypothetical protein